MVWPEFVSKRTQDLEKVYHDAGQWYWFNIKRLKDKLFTNNSGSTGCYCHIRNPA